MFKSLIGLTMVVLSFYSFAADATSKDIAISGQNAFTRAVQKPLENIVTPVKNTNDTPCNSIVECRKYGGDLQTKWQLNNTTDTSPKDYPENCYVLGKDGKYVYSPSTCANYRN